MFSDHVLRSYLEEMGKRMSELQDQVTHLDATVRNLQARVSYPERLKQVEEYQKWGGTKNLVIMQESAVFYTREFGPYGQYLNPYTEDLQLIIRSLKAEWAEKHQCEVKK